MLEQKDRLVGKLVEYMEESMNVYYRDKVERTSTSVNSGVVNTDKAEQKTQKVVSVEAVLSLDKPDKKTIKNWNQINYNSLIRRE